MSCIYILVQIVITQFLRNKNTDNLKIAFCCLNRLYLNETLKYVSLELFLYILIHYSQNVIKVYDTKIISK